jgi:hypothetical protein
MAENGGGVILTWNATNWVTVTLMAAVGFVLIGLGQKVWANRKSQQAAA